MNGVRAPTMMHISCKFGECSLNNAGVIALRCYTLEGQGPDLKGEGQGHHNKVDRQNSFGENV